MRSYAYKHCVCGSEPLFPGTGSMTTCQACATTVWLIHQRSVKCRLITWAISRYSEGALVSQDGGPLIDTHGDIGYSGWTFGARFLPLYRLLAVAAICLADHCVRFNWSKIGFCRLPLSGRSFPFLSKGPSSSWSGPYSAHPLHDSLYNSAGTTIRLIIVLASTLNACPLLYMV